MLVQLPKHFPAKESEQHVVVPIAEECDEYVVHLIEHTASLSSIDHLGDIALILRQKRPLKSPAAAWAPLRVFGPALQRMRHSACLLAPSPPPVPARAMAGLP